MGNNKGLTVHVLRNTIGDCTNNGVTSNKDCFLLVDSLLDGLYSPKENEVYLKLVRRNIYINEPDFIHAIPMINGKPLNEGKSSMFGGNFIYCSDSRISELNRYPIPVHDRFEF